jgi:hypothetical protein
VGEGAHYPIFPPLNALFTNPTVHQNLSQSLYLVTYFEIFIYSYMSEAEEHGKLGNL